MKCRAHGGYTELAKLARKPSLYEAVTPKPIRDTIDELVGEIEWTTLEAELKLIRGLVSGVLNRYKSDSETILNVDIDNIRKLVGEVRNLMQTELELYQARLGVLTIPQAVTLIDTMWSAVLKNVEDLRTRERIAGEFRENVIMDPQLAPLARGLQPVHTGQRVSESRGDPGKPLLLDLHGGGQVQGFSEAEV